MSQSKVIALASQGEPEAIALLLNHLLKSRKIQVRVMRKQNHLHILLEADVVPKSDMCIPLVQSALVRLQVTSIQSVRIYGRQRGQKKLAWTKGFAVKSPSTLQPSQVEAQPQTQFSSQPNNVEATPSPLPLLQRFNQLPKQSQKFFSQMLTQKRYQVLLILGGISFLMGSGWNLWGITPQSTRQTLFAPSEDMEVSAEVDTLATPTPTDIAETPTTITIKAVGDIIPGTNFPSKRLPPDKEKLFAGVLPYFYGADILFGNFESTLTNYPHTPKDVSRGTMFAFRTPPEYAKLLKSVGFDVMSVANNHSFDFGEQGFKDTIRNVQEAGMLAVGEKGEITYLEVKDTSLAFIGFSTYAYHNSVLDLEAAKALVQKAKQNADIIIISVHAGAEGLGALHTRNATEYYHGENRGNKILFARSMIDAGADLVLGHGPHVPRAIELYEGKFIAYSLGNFLGYQTLSTTAQMGYSLILEVELDEQGDFLRGRIIPVSLSGEGIPQIDQQFRSVSLMRYLTQTDFPETPLKIERNGEIVRQD